MKTITKIYNVYEYKELSKEAKERAHTDWNNNTVEYPFLEENMTEKCIELLTKNNIIGTPKVFYSLSSSQGDGAMFEGTFEWKNYSVSIKHSGRYYHSNSKTVDILTTKTESEANEKTYNDFETIYHSICKDLESFGYQCIEQEQSEENFREICEANEYTFTIDGKMSNE